MRKLLLSLCTIVALGMLANLAVAQGPEPERKWIPSPSSTLGTGYYVVDNYDAAPTPWRPIYKFVDTLFEYNRGLWHHVANGPRSFIPQPGFPPTVYWHSIAGDSTDNTFAGPIPIGFRFNFYGNDYDSVYLSSNGYIGFGGYTRASGGDGPSYASKTVAPAFPNASLPKNIAAFMMTDGFLVHGEIDTSIAYYKTTLSTDTLYISLYNYFLSNNTLYSYPTGWIDKIRMDVQVVLTRQDSSITFMYRKFYGIMNVGLFAYQASELFRVGGDPGGNLGNPPYASMIGVQDSLQAQGTTYMANGRFTSAGLNADMNEGMAVKFKRWPNIVQADSILFPPRNYEMLLGDSLFPIAVYGNVSPLPQTFYCIFRIRSLLTGQTVYEAQDSVNNLAAGATQRIYFPPYYTYTLFKNQVGPMFAEAIASPYKNIDQFIGDYWPFDDTIRQKMFVVQQVPSFEDFSDGFSNPVLLPGTIPDALLWVNINANVVDGDQYTFNPPPPRGAWGDTTGGKAQINSPVILMDRRDANGLYYDPCATNVGDTIISFPIDLHSVKNALLGFSYERAGKQNYPRWYDLSTALGPERTVVDASDPSGVYRIGDSLEVDYASPYEITNVQTWTEKYAADGGKDYNFNRVYLPIDSTETSGYFRFRVRLKEKDDFEPGNPIDDADEWFLDNFIVSNPVKPEIEVSYVALTNDWPYVSVPASQATAVPITARVANNGGKVAVSFGLDVRVYPHPLASDPARVQGIPLPLYRALTTIPVLPAGTTDLISGGQWNARRTLGLSNQFDLVAMLEPKNYDSEPLNDSTYNTITMTFGDSYQYDAGSNDIPGFFSIAGLGLSTYEGPKYSDPVGGTNGGDLGGSGTIAVEFKVFNIDTIYGANLFLGSLNQANDAIRITLYKGDASSTVPGDTLANGCTLVNTTRTGPWDQYNTYKFNCGPVILPAGVYWIGVSQLATTGLQLGGDASRSSVDWIAYDRSGMDNHIFTINYPELNGRFAFENTAGSNAWNPFYYPGGIGKPAYAYTTYGVTAKSVFSPACGKIYNYFFGQGSWIPMIRPFFGRRLQEPPAWDTTVVPVELAGFTGHYVTGYVALKWNTASELNNNGYYVERTVKGADDWAKLNEKIIPGYGTTAEPHDYSYNDQTVAMATTYQYRLQQVDNNGMVHYSNTVEVTTPPVDYMLSQNYPNPFNNSTDISYALPVAGNVKVTVYDVAGREVKLLVNGYQEANGQYNIQWDGTNDNGAAVASGSYIYKMEANGHTFSHTLTLTR